MILERYLLTELLLNIELSYQVIKYDVGRFKGSMAPMIGLG